MPGVIIGESSIIGAGSLVTKSIPKNSVAVGNPAKVICTYEDYISKEINKMKSSEIFDESFICNKTINVEKNEEMIERLGKNIGYMK